MKKALSAAANPRSHEDHDPAHSTSILSPTSVISSPSNAVTSASASPRDSSRASLLDLLSVRRDPVTGHESFTQAQPELNEIRNSPYLIVDVWQHNLREVFDKIMYLVEDFPYIAMDTEFPGVVARPLTTTSTGKNLMAYHYQTIKMNVDLLKLIQLGLCFCNAEGEISKGLPGMYPSSTTATNSNTTTNGSTQLAASNQPGGIVYQFHFKFSLTDDMYAQDSIDMLAHAGIDFVKHASQGIDVTEFSELLITSGVVLNDEVRWLSFHSGFDFAYLLHILIGGGHSGLSGGESTGTASSPTLPTSEIEFFELLQIYFPCVYDIKQLLKLQSQSGSLPVELSQGGLEKLSRAFDLTRLGPKHQAGSDALLTAALFFRVRERYFSDLTPPSTNELMQASQTASNEILAAAAERSGATTTNTNATSPTNASEKMSEKEKEQRDREAYAAGTDVAQSLLHQHQLSEERYLGLLYGLQPTANSLLRQSREKERAQTTSNALTVSDDIPPSSSPPSSKVTSRAGSISIPNQRSIASSPSPFKPATGSPP